MEHEITVPFDQPEPIMEPVTIEPQQILEDMKETYSLNEIDTTNDLDQEETIMIKTKKIIPSASPLESLNLNMLNERDKALVMFNLDQIYKEESRNKQFYKSCILLGSGEIIGARKPLSYRKIGFLFNIKGGTVKTFLTGWPMAGKNVVVLQLCLTTS